ncbi:type III PLP-dependent enzyme [Hamadaea tsunoensis]|uniref:type III PLP-dependent enzyme n=1 Tax=Hamadaea tsunoensis TaxID=53368 RepID=UPI0004187C1C|nr:type III PLP-dependent enzyme [Hamadaea tsunoensis]
MNISSPSAGVGDAEQQTPYLLFDVGVAVAQYRRLTQAFGDATAFYAVKANPQPRLLSALVAHGSAFDIASPAEMDLCLDLGADPSALSYGNTIKKAADIAYAFDRGVRMFAFDSESELDKLAKYAPGAAVYCRIAASSAGAQWPLSNKFGCSPEMAVALLLAAADQGLAPVGVSFHVGSQQLDPTRWGPSVADAARVFKAVEAGGVRLTLLNAGGGFPAAYRQPVRPIEDYAGAIRAAMDRHFDGDPPALAIEPGRYVAAAAGVLRAQVVLVARKSFTDDKRWVYLDVGRFGGLAETEGEAIQYAIATPHDGDGEDGPVILAGPTCDSVDVLYQRAAYRLPMALGPGDVVEIHGTGAYTTTYSSVGFNGYDPLATVCIGDSA